MLKFSELVKIASGTLIQFSAEREIVSLEIDSRKALTTEGTLFFAISGTRHNGHDFISELYHRGIRQFVIESRIDLTGMGNGNFLLVDSCVDALQELASYHRNQFNIPVIGVTGSNGKTIVKEWLYQLLSPEHLIAKNPGSYNSQVGVPLSVWGLKPYHTLGLFEAGISTSGEMTKLQHIIHPTIGLFTNLGTAHDEGFQNHEQKLLEKLELFKDAQVIIYRKDQLAVAYLAEENFDQRGFSWGTDPYSTMVLSPLPDRLFSFSVQGKNFVIEVPFVDPALQENALHCVAVMYYLGYDPGVINERLSQLRSIPMRLELKQGINHCQIIDDTYNNDLAGLQISLNFLAGMRKGRNTLIFSDVLQSGSTDEVWVSSVAEIVSQSVVTHFIGIGPALFANRLIIEAHLASKFFVSTEEFLASRQWEEFQGEVILVKGARLFRFEKIVQKLQKKIHGTVMEVDLAAMVHNLNYFRSNLKQGIKLMVMVKAFAYGSGSEEVTHLLQYHKVDYLGVAYPDEGVELRKNHIHLPIMVMNPSEESFPILLEHQLEPEIFSLSMLRSLVSFLEGRSCNIHLKLDSGMHRLGFDEAELQDVIRTVLENPGIKVVSIFSHLAAADEQVHDEFSRTQAKCFLRMAQAIKQALNTTPLLHLLNSSGIMRFPELQFDMVRLGIGLYGVNPTAHDVAALRPVATLKTVISQVKKVPSGETIGYGRKGDVSQEKTIATIAIGYADGYSRAFSRGVGKVMIKGKMAPVVGNVCMDMTMVDVTGIVVKEGDEVIIFGSDLPIQEIAASINTIPYEILTSTNERVKRVFFTESI